MAKFVASNTGTPSGTFVLVAESGQELIIEHISVGYSGTATTAAGLVAFGYGTSATITTYLPVFAAVPSGSTSATILNVDFANGLFVPAGNNLLVQQVNLSGLFCSVSGRTF